MSTTLYVMSGLLGGIFIAGILFFFFLRSRQSRGNSAEADKTEQGLVLLQNQLNHLTQTIDTRLGDSHRDMSSALQKQHGQSSTLIREITERLGALDETNKQVVNFADELKSLQDILKNPKQRGALGEYYLETVLKNVLPPGRFAMQYHFENGEIVDAVVFLDKDKILPVDSKFSLENYNKILNERDTVERERLEKLFKQDVKNRIDETAKYIRPKENTMDFAFMFIPSEAVYYDLLVNHVGTRDLIEYAYQDRRVIIVSPTSFLAYLQTVLQGLRSLQIEESAKEIRKNVEKLGRHIGTYDQYMQKLGNSLGTTVNHYATATRELGKIDKDVMRITGSSAGVEAVSVPRPNDVGEGEVPDEEDDKE